VEKVSESPRLIHRECGGWLAVSGSSEPIKIGVTADTEDEAAEKYHERINAWRSFRGQARI
jgi:hypothetical protein